MNNLIDSFKKSQTLHHAYFIVGKYDEVSQKLNSFFENDLGIRIAGNPDYWQVNFKTLTIDEARDLALSAGRKSFEKHLEAELPSRKIFVIQTDFITEEAQNSLLKTFEEPTPGTHFFIISPQDILLPTLRSRVQVISNFSKLQPMSRTVLDMKIAERLVMVKEITEGINDEEKTKQDAVALLNQIETELYKKGVEKSAQSLKVCEETRMSLYDRGAPIKIILENLMLSV